MQRILKEMGTKIGLADTIELVRRWGGRELRCPVKVEPGDPLALTLGLDSARKLVHHYGGQRLQLPAERNAMLDLRNEAIVAECGAGATQEQVGLRYGLTRQAVSIILKSRRELTEVRRKYAVEA